MGLLVDALVELGQLPFFIVTFARKRESTPPPGDYIGVARTAGHATREEAEAEARKTTPSGQAWEIVEAEDYAGALAQFVPESERWRFKELR